MRKQDKAHLTPAEMQEYSRLMREIGELRNKLAPARSRVRQLKDLARKRAERQEARV